MTRSARRDVELLVCGNLDRRDDGAAIQATRGLPAVVCGQLDIDHLLAAPPGARIVIVDAATGVEPGRVVRRTFDELLANPRGPAPRSSHALPVDQVIGLARALADRPIEGTFVGIGGADFGHGRELSPAVKGALPELRATVEGAV